MAANRAGTSLSKPFGKKRSAERMGVVGSATADFLSPPGLRISNLSRYGVGLSGVFRVGAHDTGTVTLYLPATNEPTVAVASVAWSDRKGHVGLKFTEFRTIATEWRPWFTTSPAEEEHGEAEDATAVAANVSAELAAAWRDAAADLRTDLGLTDRKRRIPRWVGQACRMAAIVLIIVAAAGAVLWAWQNRLHEAALAKLQVSFAKPTAQTSLPQQQAHTVTTVQLTEGEPSLEAPPRNGARPLIDRGKATRRLEVSYTGSPLAVGEQVVDVLLTIDQRGVVSNVTLVSGNPALARDVISTVGHWRYTPFLVDSAPASIKLPITAIFRTKRAAASGAREK